MTARVLFWVVPVLLLAVLATQTRCFGGSLPSGYGVDETVKMCTPQKPCITDTDGPTEEEIVYLCGARKALDLLSLKWRHYRIKTPMPRQCDDSNSKYEDELIGAIGK